MSSEKILLGHVWVNPLPDRRGRDERHRVPLLLWGVSAVRRSSDNSQVDSLRQAILRSAVHCYAMKGRYPESLDYIKEHYGIDWDPDRYVIDYEIMGSNLMPDVTVFQIGDKEAPHAD